MAMRALAIIVALFAAGSAWAQKNTSVISFGGSDARLCYEAAEISTVSAGTLGNCNDALQSGELSKRDRIATLINRGIIQNHHRDYTAAFADFEAALALNSKTSAAYVNRGNSYFSTQHYDSAIDDYTTALQMEPQNSYIAHFNRGLAHEAQKNVQLALKDFIRVNELRPGWRPAENRLKQYRKKGVEESH
ncbi:MAG: tetratricopeptide repeat protein [Deltaproteobacteria bacterium]|nr:tetratricopeptide repeat protein [Deltaproteobacteria bacterium]